MGFYGNITNTTRTQFQFDRIYPNRYRMDQMVSGDGVYPGRFVLIEYDKKETFLESIYLYNDVPYKTIVTEERQDFYDKDKTIKVYDTPEASNEFIVVNKEVYQNKDDLLILYGNESVTVPVGRKVTTQNRQPIFIQFKDETFTGYDNVSDMVDPTTNQNIVFKNGLDTIKGLLIEQGVTTEQDWPDIMLEWEQKLSVYLINGKIVFNTLELFNDFPDLDLQDFGWVIYPGDEYITNTYDLYYKISVKEEDMDDDGVYSKFTFIPIAGADEIEGPFVANFNIDREWYKTSRGYDSTVWQKTFVDGIEKYVMVAELNTVVPTFDVINDAPSLLPLTPHFDGASTNVYYRLHWQPNWAIRTKAANNHHKGQIINSRGEFTPSGAVNLTEDKTIYPSDQKTVWKGTFYNTINNTVSDLYYNYHKNLWEEPQTDELGFTLDYGLPAAIYYNKDGFNPEKVFESEFLCEEGGPFCNPSIKNSGWIADEDKIGFFPTGKSGHSYNDHKYSLEGSPQVDTQEFIMMLPSIGNTMSSIWDIIYGGRNTNETIKNSYMRNLDVYWEDGKAVPERRGLRLVGHNNGYNTAEVNTVAGAINSVHDVMGMIITSAESKRALENSMDSLSMDRIYYSKADKTYYRKKKTYVYTEIPHEEVEQGSIDDFYQEVGNTLVDFKKEYLENSDTVYYQDYNSRIEDYKLNPTKFDYIQEIKYQPNQLYFNLDERNIELFSNLDSFIPNHYFSVKQELEPNVLKMDTASKPNVDDEDPTKFVRKTYYEVLDMVSNGFRAGFDNYQYFLKLPSAYPEEVDGEIVWTTEDNVYGEYVHGIYKPNTYFYKDEHGNYIMDTSPVKGERSYYTVTLSEDPFEDGEIEEKPTYILKVTYRKAPITEKSDGTVEGYQSGRYYYIKSGQGVLLSDVYSGAVDESNVVLAVGSYNDLKNSSSVARFTESGKSIFLFERDYRYELNTTVSYDIVAKEIKLKDFHENSIFIPQFDNSLGENLIGFKFLTRDEIPVTKWVKTEDGADRLAIVAPPKEVIDKDGKVTIVEEEYTKKTALYCLGLIKASDDAASFKRFIGLDDIYSNHRDMPGTNAEPYHIVRTSGTFFESGIYHYHPSNTEEQGDSFFLDTGFVKQQKPANDPFGPADIEYYQIGMEDISLLPGTFTYVQDGVFDGREESRYYGRYYCTNPSAADDAKIFKPVVTTLPLNTPLYSVKPKKKAFYEPNQYYIKLPDGTYSLARSEDMPTGVGKFYERNGVYVIEDPNGYYTPGAEWNVQSDEIYPGVVLGTREEKYVLEKIRSFARVDDTMHGLILRLNQILETYDDDTRDLTTVKGCINKLNDIIAQFDEMKSGEIIMVDEYGRHHSAGWTTRQTYNNTNYGVLNSSGGYQQSGNSTAENKWIKFATSADHANPTITINHMFTAATSTTTAANKNTGSVSGTAGLNNSTNDTLKLYTPIVDNMGHVVGKNEETVTLPYSFKTIALTQSADTARSQLTTNTQSIVANKTKDTLTIAAANKWIRTAGTDSTTNKLSIAHEVHTITTAAKDTTDFNQSAVSQEFTVQDLIFDEAGHVTANQAHTYKLPDNFKTVKIGVASTGVAEGAVNATAVSITADNKLDILTINPNNRWITLQGNASNDTFTIGHAFAGDDTGRLYGDASAQTPAFGATFKVPYFGVDEAGHVKTKSAHTVKIPLPSLTNGTGNVVTGLTLTPSTGAFVETKANVGTLPITGFDPNVGSAVLQVTDSINTALGKLQARIAAHETVVNNLDVNDAAVDGQYVSQVKQTNGKIAVTRVALTTALDSVYAPLTNNVNKSTTFSYTTGATDSASKTIAWLFKKVADLEAEIDALTNA